MSGPLSGVRVLELSGQGPGPFACMLLADMGADVVTVERVGAERHPFDAHGRGRRYVGIDVKTDRGRDLVLDLAAEMDVLVEGFRPGVAERLGLGPDDCTERNPGLVYARMTGWGQDGPLAQDPGHDLTYLAASGALAVMGESARDPMPPLNLVADYGAGGPFLVIGTLAALQERHRSGCGQVVDAAMVDGLAAMLAPFHAMAARGSLAERGTNLLDGGAPFYRTYRTRDGRWIAVGAIEHRFYLRFLDVLGLSEDELGPQMDTTRWAGATKRIGGVVETRSREEWMDAFTGRDACVSPVLDLREAVAQPHAEARSMFDEVDGIPWPTAVPRFSRTPGVAGGAPALPGADTDDVLDTLGLEPDEIAELRAASVVA